MNQTWLGMAQQGVDASMPMLALQTKHALLAQTTSPGSGGSNVVEAITANLGASLLDLVKAIAILVVGWLVALIAAAVVRGLLKRTEIDNQLAKWLTGGDASAESPPVEKWAATAVFWIIFIFTLVAFLEALQLAAVSEPLNNFLNQVIGYLPAIAGAAILLAVAWLVATLVKLLVTRTLSAFNVDERLGQQIQDADAPAGSGFSLGETIGNTLYWFVFLLFLPSILSTLGLQGTLEPVQAMLDDILSILPNVFAACVIGFAGWLIAQVVRRIVTNLLSAAGTDQVGQKFGLAQSAGTQSLSWIVGTVVYVLILIPTAIAALNALRIEAISAPAIAMLNDILGVLPQIFTAAVILVIAYVIGQFLAELVSNILTGIGFNNIFYWLGFQSQPYVAATAPTPTEPVMPDAGVSDPTSELTPYVRPTEENQAAAATAMVKTRTPSEMVGIIVWVGVVLFATLAAVNILNIEALTSLVAGIVLVSGRILAGLVVFSVGLYLANLAFSLITSSGGRQSRILGQTARIAIIALVSAMALQQIGVASNIVNLAFGLLLGAIAVAIALAFGLGGRDIAAEQIREWLASFKRE